MGEAAVLHYPDGNSVLIVQEKSVLGIFGGIAKTFSPPEEVEVESGASLVGVRASSMQDFVLVDTLGGVYQVKAGKVVERLPQVPGFRHSWLRSVAIAPNGKIFGIRPAANPFNEIYSLQLP